MKRRRRIPGSYDVRVLDVVNGRALVVNPDWPVEHGRLRACHDGSPSIDLDCDRCGSRLHVHASQLAGAPAGADLAARCPRCEKPLLLSRSFLEAGFAIAATLMEPTT